MDIGSFFENLYKMAKDENRIVQQTSVGDVIVSTVYTYDCGYETAIIDIDGMVYPVERYGNKDAEKGHWVWCEKVKTIEEVFCLGYSLFDLDGNKIKLKRKK